MRVLTDQSFWLTTSLDSIRARHAFLLSDCTMHGKAGRLLGISNITIMITVKNQKPTKKNSWKPMVGLFISQEKDRKIWNWCDIEANLWRYCGEEHWYRRVHVLLDLRAEVAGWCQLYSKTNVMRLAIKRLSLKFSKGQERSLGSFFSEMPHE